MLNLKIIEKQWLKLYGIQVKSDNLASRSEIRFHISSFAMLGFIRQNYVIALRLQQIALNTLQLNRV